MRGVIVPVSTILTVIPLPKLAFLSRLVVQPQGQPNTLPICIHVHDFDANDLARLHYIVRIRHKTITHR